MRLDQILYPSSQRYRSSMIYLAGYRLFAPRRVRHRPKEKCLELTGLFPNGKVMVAEWPTKATLIQLSLQTPSTKAVLQISCSSLRRMAETYGLHERHILKVLALPGASCIAEFSQKSFVRASHPQSSIGYAAERGQAMGGGCCEGHEGEHRSE